MKKFIKLLVFLIICIFFIKCSAPSREYIRSENFGKGSIVIANWNVVPSQRFNGEFKAGVIAFDGTGVDVEFYVNDLYKGVVTKPALNDRTNTYEYVLELNAADYSDGALRLKFIARADNNKQISFREKELVLYANSKGSLTNNTIKYAGIAGNDNTGSGTAASPYRTIEKAFVETGDGGTVVLLGDSNTEYEVSCNLARTSYKYWTTIRSEDPGNPVKILGGLNTASEGRFQKNFVKWEDVIIYKNDSRVIYSNSYTLRFEPEYRIWFNNVELYDAQGSGGAITGSWNFNSQGAYVYLTDCYIHDVLGVCGNGAGLTTSGGEFWRDCRIENIGNDIWRACNDLFILNIDFQNYLPTSSHCDLLQWAAGGFTDNIILYNVKAEFLNAQGFISNGHGGAYNTALVNVFFESPVDSYLRSSFADQHHLLIWHCTFYGKDLYVEKLDSHSNWDIRNNIFNRFSISSEPVTSIIQNNLVTLLFSGQRSIPGINNTVEAADYVDSAVVVSSYKPVWSVDKNVWVGSGVSYNVGDIVYQMYADTGYFRCLQAHTSGNPGLTAPGVGTNWGAYWERQAIDPYEKGKPYDYHLNNASPGKGSGVVLECVPVDINNELYDQVNPSPGAFR